MRIAVHAFAGMTLFHLSSPLLVFGEVTRLGLAEGWSTTVWSDDGGAVRTAEGLLVDDLQGPDAATGADLLVFPSWPASFPRLDDALGAVVRDAHAAGTRIAGLCLGAFPVVESGVLDGRSAVTHWGATQELARRRPAVAVDESALYVDHGDVLTSAGTASALDSCLHVVRTALGSAAATTLARHLVVAPHRDGDQAQYVDRPLPEPGGADDLWPTLHWALAHLGADLGVDALAAHAGMSTRNFIRRFSQVVGSTPARWVLRRRLDEARRLLEVTDWPVERVARACGFGSVVTLRQNFAATFATTPTAYRRRFAAT
ncbi:helix-turn-helix domain-containing protein [Nocardioides sp. ChNu-153]|uniref:GlxA family transcriptional regulator n=1 Tax=Nocardioides sp. ChNu-153 TaxID=2779364 RepID=UPI00264C7F50|nr:helix-turn-helix domain-containing protein [Nocardioides sp. ChNu-153]MDN7120384.1 helix-turn-helix domain-containing protein [Nocardioides sp. ChNu-153]